MLVLTAALDCKNCFKLWDIFVIMVSQTFQSLHTIQHNTTHTSTHTPFKFRQICPNCAKFQ